MSWAEIAWRIGQLARTQIERHGIARCRPAVPQGRGGAPWCAELPSSVADADAIVGAADAILAGRFDVFALRAMPLGFPPVWNRDPRTGVEVPLRFGKTIDYRDETVVGDVKYLWEVNRHLELVTLAQAYRLTGEARFSEGCRTLLTDWFTSCPYPLGPNWTSSLEHAYRLVNWCVAWHLLGADDAPIFDGPSGTAFKRGWLASVREHCHFIAGYLSRHSSANNHLLGELTGLLTGAVTWPLWPESRRWRDIAARGLQNEGLAQNAPDGVNREQAFHYQRSVIDMMLFAGLLGRENGVRFDADWWERLERMIGFVAAMTDVRGGDPATGDADDAMLVRWSPEADCSPNHSLLATGAALFGRTDWAARAARFDAKSLWLLGAAGARTFAELRGRLPPHDRATTLDYPDGGYWLFEHARNDREEILGVLDCGPLGYPSIAAHGHADALSFVLTVAGEPILVDPGTFAYHTEPRWRSHFRSTAAHNTVCIDGLDQSVSGGAFLWLEKARAWCVGTGEDDDCRWVIGAHDGYRRLPAPVEHRRTVRFHRASRRFEIIDELSAQDDHRAALTWQFGPGCAVREVGDSVIATAPGSRTSLTVSGVPYARRLLSGQTDPPAGWVSRRYDEKVPATCAVWDFSVRTSVRLVTIVDIELG